MNVWQCIILGVIQGATEFLPVSSSGHLLLAYRIMGLPDDLSFTLSLHLSTLAAVLVAMRKQILPLIKRPFCKQTGMILLSSLPTAIIAATVYFFRIDLSPFLGIGFALTALLLLFSCEKGKSEVGAKQAVFIGITQGLAVMPGLSRSGSTISVAKMLGVEHEKAVTYSFLLSVPVIVGSFLADAVSGGFNFSTNILIGCVFAFFTGLASIKFMLNLFNNPKGFIIYLTALSALVTLNDTVFKMF